jgi:hypothetical protein
MSTSKRQVVVPFNQLPEHLMTEALKAKKHRWNPVLDNTGRLMGFHAPRYGAIMHYAYVIAEIDDETGQIIKIEEFQFDQMVRKDGPISDPYSHATPNAMAVVIEERQDGFYVWSVKEWRPVIYDHREDKQGVEVVGVTGGWAKKVGDDPVQTALEELIAEAGLEVDQATVERINIHTPNRAFIETCNEVYLAVFKRKGKRQHDRSHEVIEGQVAYRLDEFPLGPDALVNSALWAVAKHLGCISPKPLRTNLNKTK